MIQQLFIDVPVADLPKSLAFFQSLGFAADPQFTGDATACVIVNDSISLMLMTHSQFRQFTPKAVCDTSQAVEILFCLRCESREEVDALVSKALAAGGTTYDKAEDFGFMYSHSFVDLDGHGWGLTHLSGPPPRPSSPA
ncbi:MAG: glyoxalase/bleomycin resistance/extradiol dioxygenase family protein [Opitutae bacterium]|nr:glyoxalase/bleomycin resistance/extradiol dioxygenase family protein [Opitutae bacterium]